MEVPEITLQSLGCESPPHTLCPTTEDHITIHETEVVGERGRAREGTRDKGDEGERGSGPVIPKLFGGVPVRSTGGGTLVIKINCVNFSALTFVSTPILRQVVILVPACKCTGPRPPGNDHLPLLRAC